MKKHEIRFVFNTEVDVKQIVSREDHVSFFWFSMDQFIEANIAPPAMKDAILEWTAEKDAFFIESNNSQ